MDPIEEYIRMLEEYVKNPSSPDIGDMLSSLVPKLRTAYDSGDFTSFKGFLPEGVDLNSNLEDYLNQQISNQLTNANNAYQTQMRDTSLLSSAAQLQQLGLSPSNVASVGGASSGVYSGAANNLMTANNARIQDQRKYYAKMQIMRNLSSLVGSMAHAGISGGMYYKARSILAKQANKTAVDAVEAAEEVENAQSYPPMTQEELAELRQQQLKELGYLDDDGNPTDLW